MRSTKTAPIVPAALLLVGCAEERPAVCILTARDTVQAEDELQGFMAHEDDDSLYEISCRSLPDDTRRALLEIPPGGDEDDVPLRQLDGDEPIEYIRMSSQDAEDFLAGDVVEDIDVAWGLGISYLERAEARHSERQGIFLPYHARALPEILGAIASWDPVRRDKLAWFVDSGNCWGVAADACQPRYAASTAYTNVLCINDAALAALDEPECSCRDSDDGCSSSSACPPVELCPDVYGLDPDRTEYSWDRLLCTPALRGHLAMPRPDSSGTGLIATYALSSWLGGEIVDAVQWLGAFARQQSVRFTSSGSSPCKMANASSEQEATGGEEVVIGISYVAAFKGVELRAESDDGQSFRVRAGTLESGLGYEPEGTALIHHEIYSERLRDERRIRRLGASRFVDWVLSREGRKRAAQTSSVVIHAVTETQDTGVCVSILDCISDWALLDYARIPDDKFQVQTLFEMEVCASGEVDCGS